MSNDKQFKIVRYISYLTDRKKRGKIKENNEDESISIKMNDIRADNRKQLNKKIKEPHSQAPKSSDFGMSNSSPNNKEVSNNDEITKIESGLESKLDKDSIINEQAQEQAQGHRKKKSTIMAIYVGLLTAVGGFLYGYDTGIINSLTEMEYFKVHFAANGVSFRPDEFAILTAILSIGTFFGALSAPLLSDHVGRKLSIIVCLLTLFDIGTVLQIAATGLKLMYAGRFINGFGVGVISAIIPLYQAEVSPKWVRGSIISLYQWAITWGLLVSSAISQGTHSIDDARCYRIPIAMQLVWANCLALGMCFLPESPRFYVMNNKIDKALTSLARLRRLSVNDSELIEELIEIKAAHDYEMSFGKNYIWDCFRDSPSRVHQLKRMLTGIFLQGLQQCTGINFIFYYGVNFFVRTGVQKSYLISFITYAVNVASTVPGILLVETLGRRKLLIFGALGMSLSNYLIAIVGVSTKSIVVDKVMIAFVCVFITFYASTWGPVVFVVVGELYSLSIRQKAVSMTISANWLVNFIFAYSTPYLIDEGKKTAELDTKIFFLWGSLNLLGLVVAYFFVYETKGLMLEEVDELYRVCKNARKSSSYLSKIGEMSAIKKPNRDGIKQKELDSLPLSTDSETITHSEIDSVDNELPSTLTSIDINRWQPRMQESSSYANIMSDNILSKRSDGPPSITSTYDDENDEEMMNYDYGLYGNLNLTNRNDYSGHGAPDISDEDREHQMNLSRFMDEINAHIIEHGEDSSHDLH